MMRSQKTIIKVIVVDSEDTQKTIYRLLVYRKDCRGRALSKPIPQLHLQKWDRLIPTRSLQDVSCFESMDTPFTAIFWRMKKTDRVVHDCPLLEIRVLAGFGYSDWVVDILHSWCLGPLGALVAKVLYTCVRSGIFSPASAYLSAEDRDRLAMLHIKSLCTKYYANKRESDPRWKNSGTEALGILSQ